MAKADSFTTDKSDELAKLVSELVNAAEGRAREEVAGNIARLIAEVRQAPPPDTLPFGGLNDTQRLAALASMLGCIASSVHAARQTLFEEENLSDQVFVTAEMLGQVGWMAERGAMLAGETVGIFGGADDWLLSPRTQELLQPAEG